MCHMNKLAQEQICEFIDRMKKLGFEKEEIVELLTRTGGEKHE